MFRPGFSLCLVVSLCTAVSASRVLATKLVSTDSAADAPHKCTVIWKYRDQVASASFGVSSCVTECIGTNNDFNPEAIFKQAFTYKQKGRECECYGPDGAVKLKFHGKCGKDAAAKCWHDYQSLATDTWEKQINVKTLVIKHHKEQYRLHQFDYKEIQCEVDGCDGKEDCFESKLPSILAGRSADVMQHIGNIIKQIGTGEIERSALDKDMQNIIDQIGEADKELARREAEERAEGQFEAAERRRAERDRRLKEEAARLQAKAAEEAERNRQLQDEAVRQQAAATQEAERDRQMKEESAQREAQALQEAERDRQMKEESAQREAQALQEAERERQMQEAAARQQALATQEAERERVLKEEAARRQAAAAQEAERERQLQEELARREAEERAKGQFEAAERDRRLKEEAARLQAKAAEEGLGEADKLFYSLGAKDGPNDVTVGMLKDAYEDKLAGTGISVDHMLQVAGMDPVNGLDQVITSEDFERFLKPSCPE